MHRTILLWSLSPPHLCGYRRSTVRDTARRSAEGSPGATGENLSPAVIGRDRCQSRRLVVVMPGQGKRERRPAQPPAYFRQRFPTRPYDDGCRLTPVDPWGWCSEFAPMFK